jgi:phosphoglycerate dehydrogenase-like enzyme
MVSVCFPVHAESHDLSGLHPDAEVVFWDTGQPDPMPPDAEFIVPGYINAPMSADQLTHMSRLRVVQLMSAGAEPWLPVLPTGVTLCNGRGVHGGSTAELAVGGLIALVREFPSFAVEQAAGRWAHRKTKGVGGMRVLVLGAGDIARRVEKVLTALEAEVSLVGRTARPGVAGVGDFREMAASCDALILCAPYSAETHQIVDGPVLASLKNDAFLVNVARGALVDTDALIAELESRRISAFLDVTDPEPLPAGHKLWTAPQLIVTPHIGGGVDGWAERGYRLAVEQVNRMMKGERLINLVIANQPNER